MNGNEASIEFTFNDAYFREFHDEWQATIGRGWRVDRILIGVFAGLALVVAAGALLFHQHRFLWLALLLAGIAAFESVKRVRRRHAWLAHCRALPWYGRRMRVVLRDGALVQENDFAGDPRFRRTGEIRRTPRGWLVRYVSDGVAQPTRAVSSTQASVYLPHRALHPPMPPDAFARRVGAV